MKSDVVYVKRGDRALAATLYQPDGRGPFPAVVSVHGGAWTGGDRLGNVELDLALRDDGIVVLAIDFRMPPEAGYPAAVQDLHAAIRWLKRNAADVQGEPSSIGVVGSSSGGQTALLCALRPADPLFADPPAADGPDAAVAYVAVGWPIADPHARYRMARERGNAKLVAAHDAYFGDEATMLVASPQRIVTDGDATAMPPVLIVQGTADANVTPDMAQNFAQAYRRAGGACEVHEFPGEPHSFIKDGTAEAAAEAKRLIAAFIHSNARRTSALPA